MVNKFRVIYVYDIDWETDGIERELPSKTQFYMNLKQYKEIGDDEVLMNEFISDRLSYKYGWLVNDYSYKTIFVTTHSMVKVELD